MERPGETLVRHLSSSPTSVTDLMETGADEPVVRKRLPKELVDEQVLSLLEESRPEGTAWPVAHRLEGGDLVVDAPFVAGETLDGLVASQGPLAPADVALLGRWLCRSASALHRLGVVHRDITPANVVVGQASVTLIDVANARRFDSRPEASRDTRVLGTYGYAAPEQFGFAATDPRSDIFSIGKVMAFAACGGLPAELGGDGRWKAFSDENPKMAAAIGRATAFEPSARFENAEAFARAIEEAARNERRRAWIGPRKRRVAVSALLVALPALALAYDWWRGLTASVESLGSSRIVYLVTTTVFLVFFVCIPFVVGALKVSRPMSGQSRARAFWDWLGLTAVSWVIGTVLTYILSL